jgi:hypothetical protein
MVAFSSKSKRTVAAEGQRIYVCDEHFEPIEPSESWPEAPRIRFAAKGRLIAEGAGRSLVWDVRARRVVGSVVGGMGRLPRVPVLDDRTARRGNLLFFHDGESVVVHNIDEGRIECRLEGTGRSDLGSQLYTRRRPMRFLPSFDGNRVLVGLVDNGFVLVRWFDTKHGKEVGRCRIPDADLFPGDTDPLILWCAPDGAEFGYMTPDSRLAIVDARTGKVVRSIGKAFPPPKLEEGTRCTPEWGYPVAVQPDVLAQANAPRGETREREVLLFDVRSARLLQRFVTTATPGYASLSTDRRLVADRLSPRSLDVRIHETASGTLRATITTRA